MLPTQHHVRSEKQSRDQIRFAQDQRVVSLQTRMLWYYRHIDGQRRFTFSSLASKKVSATVGPAPGALCNRLSPSQTDSEPLVVPGLAFSRSNAWIGSAVAVSNTLAFSISRTTKKPSIEENVAKNVR